MINNWMKSLALVLGLTGTVFAQSVSKNGMKYQMLKDIPGETAKLGELVRFHVIIENSEGTELQNTYKMAPEPQVAEVIPAQVSWSYEEIFTLMSAGDSAQVFVPSDSLFSPKFGQQRPPSIKEHSEIKFVFKLFQIQSKESFEAELKERAKALEKEEDDAINTYLTKNKLIAKKTESGLYYVQKSKPSTNALQAKSGDTVKVHYTGMLLDSSKFDSSVDRGTPFEFNLGARQVIAGWDEGIALMHKGEKGLLLIPSRLGYGERGAGESIPPNSILMFEVELVDINNGKVPNSSVKAPAKTSPSSVKQKANTSTKPKTTTKKVLK